MALAGGKVWVLPTLYVEKAIELKRLPDERHYDLGTTRDLRDRELYIAPYSSRKGDVFKGWVATVLVGERDGELRKRITSVLEKGGAKINGLTLQHLTDKSDVLWQLTHLLVDPELISNSKMQSVLEANGRGGRRVNIVSHVYAEEVLTTRETPSPDAFDAMKEAVIEMHLEARRRQEDSYVHDTAGRGSPNLSATPRNVRLKLALADRNATSSANDNYARRQEWDISPVSQCSPPLPDAVPRSSTPMQAEPILVSSKKAQELAPLTNPNAIGNDPLPDPSPVACPFYDEPVPKHPMPVPAPRNMTNVPGTTQDSLGWAEANRPTPQTLFDNMILNAVNEAHRKKEEEARIRREQDRETLRRAELFRLEAERDKNEQCRSAPMLQEIKSEAPEVIDLTEEEDRRKPTNSPHNENSIARRGTSASSADLYDLLPEYIPVGCDDGGEDRRASGRERKRPGTQTDPDVIDLVSSDGDDESIPEAKRRRR